MEFGHAKIFDQGEITLSLRVGHLPGYPLTFPHADELLLHLVDIGSRHP